jgi:flagellin-like hook-associated protein FlgL
MDTIGFTPFLSTTFSRVTNTLSRDTILANIQRVQRELLLIQEQLASGLRVVRPSMDPVQANLAMDFQLKIRKTEQFMQNANVGVRRLSISDSTLEEMNQIINRANEIILTQVQSTSTSATRELAATEVNDLLIRAIGLANTSFEDRYIFAGASAETPPFLMAGGAVAFVGDTQEINLNVSEGISTPSNLSADAAFGVLSEEIKGIDLTTFQTIDLNPAVRSATRLSSLNTGRGVTPGSISITGSGTAIVNISLAENLGDVIDLINASTSITGVSASINPANNGLQLDRAGGGVIVVEEVSGGTTASELGIYTGSTGIPSPLVGLDLDPIVTEDTLLGDLNGGAGFDTAGIVIINAAPDTTYRLSATTIFALTNSVGNLLRSINSAGVYVEAGINSSKSGIDIFSRLSGARLTITETTGSTASDFGLLSTLLRAPLSTLNDGKGIATVDGDDLKIVRKDGVEVSFDLDKATNLRDVVNLIDMDPFLSATLSADCIVITDTSIGPNDLVIYNANGSFAATNLGIEGRVANAGPAVPLTLSGTQLTYVGVQVEGIFTALIELKSALLENDTSRIGAVQGLFNKAQQRLLDARATLGARITGLELMRNRLEFQKIELTKFLSEVRDIDIAEAATRLQLQQNALQAGLAVAARILQISILNFL